MSEITKGRYTLNIIDSTGQFSIGGDGTVEGGSIRGGDSTPTLDANDMIDLLKAYLLQRKRNK